LKGRGTLRKADGRSTRVIKRGANHPHFAGRSEEWRDAEEKETEREEGFRERTWGETSRRASPSQTGKEGALEKKDKKSYQKAKELTESGLATLQRGSQKPEKKVRKIFEGRFRVELT